MSSLGFTLRPYASTPPPSTSISLPLGNETSRLSPWPTSIAVSSNDPATTLGGKGCQKTSANNAVEIAIADQRNTRDRRVVNASPRSAAENAIASHTGGAGMRTAPSPPPSHPPPLSRRESNQSARGAPAQ